MKKVFALSLVLLSVLGSKAQSDKMVKWNYVVKKVADKTYELRMTADITDNYHMYALKVDVDGPLPTTITFAKNPAVTLDGSVKEQGKLIKKFESAWNGNANYFEDKVDFVQIVKVKYANVKPDLKGKIEFMVCDDKKCLLPSTVDFKVSVGG